MRKLWSAAVACGLLITAPGCGSDTALQTEPPLPIDTPPEYPDREIHINDFGFSPSVVEVKKGTIVRWINVGGSIHSSKSVLSIWDSGEICSVTAQTEGGCRGFGGITYGRLFSNEGHFVYYCWLHPDERGTVTVLK